MKSYPALDIRSAETDLLFAMLDDFAPTALEERDEGIRAYFADAAARDAALRSLSPRFATVATDIPDDDWARRSQAHLSPVRVGRITVFPTLESLVPGPYAIVIAPSMGFGTGHHATTRLCLAALQELDLTNRRVLDVGTGSGVLAIAAVRLGAAHAMGIDIDDDAIQAARENLALNLAAANVTFKVADVTRTALPQAGVVTANLTGALLVRAAAFLIAATRSGGTLILSGLQIHERTEVLKALGPSLEVSDRREDEWVALAVKKP